MWKKPRPIFQQLKQCWQSAEISLKALIQPGPQCELTRTSSFWVIEMPVRDLLCILYMYIISNKYTMNLQWIYIYIDIYTIYNCIYIYMYNKCIYIHTWYRYWRIMYGNSYLVNKQKWRSNRTTENFRWSTGTKLATLWLWKETVNSRK